MKITDIPSYWQFQVYNLHGSQILADRWWNEINWAFEGLTPLEAWKVDPERVQKHINVLYEHQI